MGLRSLSLCTGVAGLDLGVELAVPGSRVVCGVERNAFAAAVLVSRMEAGDLGHFPIWSDLHTFDAVPWRGVVDLVTAGYPCQPFSAMGLGLGTDDPRHLWPQVARVVRERGPALVFIENVANHLRDGFDVVAEELHAMGFRVAATLRTAESVGAPHRRERLFALAAHPDRDGFQGVASSDGEDRRLGVEQGDHANGLRMAEPWRRDAPEPGICRVDDGIAGRLDRLRVLGNAVVPQQAAAAFVELADALGVSAVTNVTEAA